MESQNPATEPDDKATIAESKEITFNAKAFDVFFQRVTTQASEGGAPSTLRRRSVDVIVDHELCRLGTFVAPIKLTLRELDSATELRVLRSLGAISQPGVDDEEDDDSADDAGQAMAMGLGKASIYALNGRPLQDFEKDLLWEALGMGGRMVVGGAFMTHGTGLDNELVGKALASVVVG